MQPRPIPITRTPEPYTLNLKPEVERAMLETEADSSFDDGP